MVKSKGLVMSQLVSLIDCPPQLLADEFGSLRTIRALFVYGNSTWRCGVWSVAWCSLVAERGLIWGNFYLYYFVLETFVNPDGWL